MLMLTCPFAKFEAEPDIEAIFANILSVLVDNEETPLVKAETPLIEFIMLSLTLTTCRLCHLLYLIHDLLLNFRHLIVLCHQQ